MDNQKTQFSQTLHTKGLRLTAQRQLILEVLYASQEHLDAEALHDQVKKRDARVSLATVYRTLALLKELDLVQQHRLGEEHAHFESVQDAPHYHFSCLKCGLVIEFESPLIAQIIQSLIVQERIQVTEAHFFLSGYCEKCQMETDD